MQVLSALFVKKIDLDVAKLVEDRLSGLWKRENEEKMRDDLHIPQFFITFVG
jgi:hypothetical protein